MTWYVSLEIPIDPYAKFCSAMPSQARTLRYVRGRVHRYIQIDIQIDGLIQVYICIYVYRFIDIYVYRYLDL